MSVDRSIEASLEARHLLVSVADMPQHVLNAQTTNLSPLFPLRTQWQDGAGAKERGHLEGMELLQREEAEEDGETNSYIMDLDGADLYTK